MNAETSKQKAARLNVPLIPRPIKLPQTEVDERHLQKDLFKQNFTNETVAVCESCGKEIKRYDKKEPCGISDCPFGILTI